MMRAFLFGLMAMLIPTSMFSQGWSRDYKPGTPSEKAAYESSDRSVYPDDVRTAFERYRNATIAWAAVIEKVTILEHAQYTELLFVCKHYYFDWVEDFGAQPARLFLASSGEGEISTSWRVGKESGADNLRNTVGDLLIIYGKPDEIRNNVIHVNSAYIRLVPARWFAHFDLVYRVDPSMRQRIEKHGR